MEPGRPRPGRQDHAGPLRSASRAVNDRLVRRQARLRGLADVAMEPGRPRPGWHDRDGPLRSASRAVNDRLVRSEARLRGLADVSMEPGRPRPGSAERAESGPAALGRDVMTTSGSDLHSPLTRRS